MSFQPSNDLGVDRGRPRPIVAKLLVQFSDVVGRLLDFGDHSIFLEVMVTEPIQPPVRRQNSIRPRNHNVLTVKSELVPETRVMS